MHIYIYIYIHIKTCLSSRFTSDRIISLYQWDMLHIAVTVCRCIVLSDARIQFCAVRIWCHFMVGPFAKKMCCNCQHYCRDAENTRYNVATMVTTCVICQPTCIDNSNNWIILQNRYSYVLCLS